MVTFTKGGPDDAIFDSISVVNTGHYNLSPGKCKTPRTMELVPLELMRNADSSISYSVCVTC